MPGFTAKIVQRPSFEKIIKNLNFGTAVGLTKTAKEGQAAVFGAVKGAFKGPNNWLRSPIGIKITPATPRTLRSEVKTSAKFLPLQDEGGTKLPYGNHLCIPATKGPLAGRRRIPPNMRPKAIMDSGKGFITTTKSGTKIMGIRGLKSRGKYAGFTIMYVLIPKANIKAANVFYDPIKKVVDRRLAINIRNGIDHALKTMK